MLGLTGCHLAFELAPPIDAPMSDAPMSDDAQVDYAAAVLADGPVAYWRLGAGSASAVDVTGNGNTGTFLGGVEPGAPGALVGDPDVAMKRAVAIAGHHVAERMCVPATDSVTGDSKKRPWVRRVHNGTKLGKVAVQHIDDVQDKGEIAIFFFPNGSAEKAVVEVTDGDDTYSILVHGLTGRVELKDKVLPDIDDHMMRNAMGDKDEKRENE